MDGRYGWDSFKTSGGAAVNAGGTTVAVPRGFDWVGWKRRGSGGGGDHLNLVFSFDGVRTFDRVVVHTNNHFTKDIQIFSQAKVYFSNEEDKFGDDR